MKLNKNYQYHILCEDAQMRAFLLAVLSAHGVNSGKIRVSNYPCCDGCGEAFVRKELPKEIQILHATNYLRKTLIVCTDADRHGVDERMRILLQEVEAGQVKWDRAKELILFWIPKREIETWIHFLKGDHVDEDTSYRHGGKPVECKKEAELFSMYCQGIEEIDCANVPSLAEAKKEYVRVCQLQGAYN